MFRPHIDLDFSLLIYSKRAIDRGTTQMQPVVPTVAADSLERFAPVARSAIEKLYAATEMTAYKLETQVFEQRHVDFLTQMEAYLKTDSGQKIQRRQYNNLDFPAELVRCYMLFEYTLAHFPEMYCHIGQSEHAHFFQHNVSMYSYFVIFQEYEKAFYTCKCIATHRHFMLCTENKANILDMAPLEGILKQNNMLLIQHYIRNSESYPAKLNGNIQNIQKMLHLFKNLAREMQVQGLWLKYLEYVKGIQTRQ
jgi:hypothetical protein